MKEYEFVRVELSTMRRRPKEDYQLKSSMTMRKVAGHSFRFSLLVSMGMEQLLILKSYLKEMRKKLSLGV